MPAQRVSATTQTTRDIQVKARRYLLGVVLALRCVAAAAGVADVDNGSDSPTEQYAADRMQRSISENINSAARWIDSFFDDDRYIAEDATTKLRFGESAFLEYGESPEYKTKVNLSIDIPHTKKRLRVFIANEDDTNKTPDTLFNRVETSEDTSAAGVQFFAKASNKQNLSLTAGVKLESIEFFIGPRYRYTLKLDSWQLRFTQRVRWFSSKGWEATTRFDFEHLLSDKLFFRQTLDGRWREEDDGYRYEIRPTLIQQVASGQLIEYQWNTLFKTSPNHRLESSILRVRYRRNFLRKWLFYEIDPQLAFRNDEGFDPKAGITFQVDVVFGGKGFLKRHKQAAGETGQLETPANNSD